MGVTIVARAAGDDAHVRLGLGLVIERDRKAAPDVPAAPERAPERQRPGTIRMPANRTK
jgi:hypothetical protein